MTGRALTFAAALLLASGGNAFAEEGVAQPDVHPAAQPVATAPERTDNRVVRYTIDLASSSKTLSLGAKLRYARYLESSIATDAFLSSMLTGFALDDQDGVRFTASQTIGTKIAFAPFSLEPRHGPRPSFGSHRPDFVAGVGVWGLTEFDSLAQGIRLGDNGVYTGVSVGAFGSLVFSDITVTLAYRPISQTRYYLDGRWDSTEMNVGNPVLDIDLSYTFP